jgi:membrane-associated HD superfamily phosphohydrolase
LTQIVERGTGATAIDKGEPEGGQQTLGEIQILVGKAGERATAMAKFYRASWYKLAVKWAALLEANPPKKIDLSKTGRSGRAYQKRVFRNDWKSESGYEPEVRSSSEQEQNEVKSIQKWQFILQQFPNNAALRQIAQKRELELVDLTPEELKQVEDDEKKQAEMAQAQAMAQGQPQPQQPNPQLAQQVQGMMAQL